MVNPLCLVSPCCLKTLDVSQMDAAKPQFVWGTKLRLTASQFGVKLALVGSKLLYSGQWG